MNKSHINSTRTHLVFYTNMEDLCLLTVNTCWSVSDCCAVALCRSLAPTAVKKRKITQRIMALAVEHQFVTPLTALLVESEDATERLLADSPKDPKHGCCSGARQERSSFTVD